jgi:hypothetical protein
MGGPEKYGKKRNTVDCFFVTFSQYWEFQRIVNEQKKKYRRKIMNGKIDNMVSENVGTAKMIIEGKSEI